MKKMNVVLAVTFAMTLASGAAERPARRISMKDYRDRMAAAWIGQSVGVAYGEPTEFKANGVLVSDEIMPKGWKPEMINSTFHQDDVYVEMSFLETMARHGIGVSCRQAGLDFANSRYRLWCANANARDNIRNGIAAPASSHPKYHKTTDDIDYQIEADFAGIISPGLPTSVLKLGETFGRIMNYGDGLWAGEFMGAMYAEAYFTSDRLKIVEAGLACIPSESKYAEMVRDMVAWYKADPRDWKGAWRKAVDKYQSAEMLGRVSTPHIDVKINGAMVLLGYLFGEGDPAKTMYISTVGGFDSDCNPSSAVGVLFTSMGLSALPKEYHEALDKTAKWEFTNLDWASLLALCERLTRDIVVAEGGWIERDEAGEEWLSIPVKTFAAAPFLPGDKPGAAEDPVMTEAEKAMVRFLPCKKQGGPSEPRP